MTEIYTNSGDFDYLDEATDIGHLIEMLRYAAAEFEKMQAKGVWLEYGEGSGNEMVFCTTDPRVAEEFDFDTSTTDASED